MAKSLTMRRALFLVAMFVSAGPARPASADHHKKDAPVAAAPKPAEPKAPAPRPGPEDVKARAILDRIASGPDPAARQAAIKELDAIAPVALDALGAFLARAHTASLEERRHALGLIKAAVPNKAGQFPQPERKTAKEDQADDDIDWLTALLAVDPAAPGVGEVIADDAAIRALAATTDIHAAQLVFDASFSAETMIYRDECGRYLRKMGAAGIPSLTIESLTGTDYDRKRYATYQLERLDRQEPGKALAAASGDEALTIAVLDAFRVTHHREAVHAVWTKIDADAPRVRTAARATWMGYVTGPLPPPAPRKKLVLPGGKLAAKETPLWLTYRELAENELRKAASDVLHEEYPAPDPEKGIKGAPIDVEDITTRIFATLDAARAKAESAQWAAAKAKADAGDLAAATAMFDALLAANPDRADRADMAKVYFAWGKALEAKKDWTGASVAYAKASGLDPKGPTATDALAAHHFTQGKALEAAGKDGGPDFRRAVALRPDYAGAKAAESRAESTEIGGHARPRWMLYAAAIAGLLALALFGAGMLRRRT